MAKPVPGPEAQADPQVILSVPRVKAELRIPPTVTGHDNLLVDQINEAAQWVGRTISAPVLDITVEDRLPLQPRDLEIGDRPWGQIPITVMEHRWVREVVRVEWWDREAGVLSQEPNRSLLPPALGRIEFSNRTAFYDALRVWPPVGGWPAMEEALPGSYLRITSTAGLDMAAAYAGHVRRAVIEGVRQFHGGYPALRFNSTFEKLLGELRAW